VPIVRRTWTAKSATVTGDRSSLDAVVLAPLEPCCLVRRYRCMDLDMKHALCTALTAAFSSAEYVFSTEKGAPAAASALAPFPETGSEPPRKCARASSARSHAATVSASDAGLGPSHMASKS